MLDKNVRRQIITQKVNDEIASPSPLEEIVGKEEGFFDNIIRVARFLKDSEDPDERKKVMKEISEMTLQRFTELQPEEGKLDRGSIRLRNEYREMSFDDRRDLRTNIFIATGLLPDYRQFTTQSAYRSLKLISQRTTFDKLYHRGYLDDALDLSMTDRVIYLPIHKSMLEPIFIVAPYLDRKLKPPVLHAGANLQGFINTYLLNRWNAMFLKRSSKEKPLSLLDMLIYAIEIEQLMEEGESQVIYPGGTRTEDGRVPPLKQKTRIMAGHELSIRPMAKGYLSCILRAVERLDTSKRTFLVPVNVDSPIFPDVMDFQTKLKTGKKPDINTFMRFFQHARTWKDVSPKTGIVIHYGEPIEIPSYITNTSENRNNYTQLIRDEFKKNTTALPEYIMAYSMNYILKNDPDYHSLPPKARELMMRDLFVNHYEYLKERHANMPDIPTMEAFEISVKFYQDVDILTEDFFIRDTHLPEYNSNTIEHLFKKDLPLTEKGLLERIRR